MRTKSKKPKDIPASGTVAQVAAWLGVSPSVLKAAKEAGCIGFRNHRCHVADIQKWLAENPQPIEGPVTLNSKRIELLVIQIERAKFQHDQERGLYILKTERDKADTRNASALRRELERLGNTVPDWCGLQAHEIKRRFDKELSSLCANLHNKQSAAYK